MTSLPSNLSVFRPLDAPQNTSCVGCYDNQTAFGSWMADNPLNQPLVRAVFIASCVLVALLCICGKLDHALKISSYIKFFCTCVALDFLTYYRVACQFLVCDTSAAFSIYAANPLQRFQPCARSMISARSLLESDLIGC